MTARAAVEGGQGGEARAVAGLLARCTPVPDTGCYLWTGAVNANGYAIVRYAGRTTLAHRVTAGLVDAPASVVARHKCDVRSCLAPEHIISGSVLDNVRDMHERGRAKKATGDDHPRRKRPELWPAGDTHWTRQHPERVLRGEENGRAKLTREQVEEILSRFSLGRPRGPGEQPGSIRALAREFRVDRTVIAGIVKGKTWRA